MSRKLWVIIAIIIFQPFQLFAIVKRWNGSVSGLWSDLLNWTPAGVPAETDEVVLDNNFVLTDFKLLSPSVSTSIVSLEIVPAPGRKIELQIPSTNTSVPALGFLGSGNCLMIRSGGTLRNSSGLTSGQSMAIAGKMVLYNGGAYVHNTRASHATGIIAKLSTEAGTDFGLFEFDVPGGAYALSMSNRNYGSLRLSATASDNAQTYNATGTSVSNVRGDLFIGRGVTLNLDLEKTLIIGGDVNQEGSVLNLASQPNNLQFIVKGDFNQDSLGSITETSGGMPVVVFEGNSTQHAAMAGLVLNSVGLSLNNSAGIILDRDLTVPFIFRFQSGKVVSGKPGRFRVGQHAQIEGASAQCFVDGPVTRFGSADFKFPVGKQIDYAPLEIAGAGGSLSDVTTVTYHHGNPTETFGRQINQSDALHISGLEYWTIERNVSGGVGTVSLEIGPYSHATLLSKLVVMGWNPLQQKWFSRGNSSYSGIGTGSISSGKHGLDAVYTVGTTVPDQNPLPVYFEALNGLLSKNEVMLTWMAHNQQLADQFIVEGSIDGINFSRLGSIAGNTADQKHVLRSPWAKSGYFRVRLLMAGGKEIQSQTVYLAYQRAAERLVLYPVPAGRMLHVAMITDHAGEVELRVEGLSGKKYLSVRYPLEIGKNEFHLPLTGVPGGLYVLRWQDGRESVSRLFLKL